MTKPTREVINEMKESLMADLALARSQVNLNDPATDRAWAGIETFCNIALRVFSKTNASKIRSEAMTVEIAARMAGRQVFDQ